jgi:hypothetical protein
MFKMKTMKSEVDKTSAVERLKNALDELRIKIKEIVSLEVGANVAKKEFAWDLCLISVFDNWQNLEIYQKHRDHQKVVGLINELVDQKALVDFEF